MSENIIQGWDANVDEAWLAQVQEDVLDPEVPIIDPHHHLWAKPYLYEAQQLLRDVQSGHKVIATVYTEAHRTYRADGPEHLKPVGETEGIVAMAEASDLAGNAPRICAGITGAGDITGEGTVDELLEAHIAAGKGRFKGLRANIFVRFQPVTMTMTPVPGWEAAVESPALLAGVRRMARKGLVLDVVCAHVHLEHVARLANQIPDLVVVLNHLSPIADFERSATESELWAAWRKGVQTVARHPNVYMKLGGCANPMMAHSMPVFRELRHQPRPRTSEELAALYRPMVSYAIETLGPSRCMFESNFPVDKCVTSYRVLWNAFKRMSAPYSDEERDALFMKTAARVYNLKGLTASNV